uniref:RRM domain-containing protein n=1 Tax=Globodera pallida TaxID=36090 RepID=A0A183CDJ2_GLOPA
MDNGRLTDEKFNTAEEKVDEIDFVLVIDPNDNEPVEIPMNSDGSLQLVTLEHAFPGAYGLKYTNPATGLRRVVSLDASSLCFCPPLGGWKGKTFSIIFRPPQNVRETRKKVEQEKAKISVPRKREHEEGDKERQEEKSEFGEESVRDEEESLDGKELEEREEEQKERRGKRSRKEWVVAGAPKECSDLYVVGIPYDLEEEALREYFEQFGSVELSEIKRDKNGQSRGFGFIRMAQYDQQVQVNPRVFVGNLEDDIGKDRLREFFLEHIRRLDRTSDIVDLYYPKPFRSFAFLTLSSSFVAKELVRQRDFIIDGSACEVTVAAPRKQDSEGQFGGERSRQLPFGPGTGLISSNDPRWNISAISSTSHQQKYQPTASIGSHHYPHAQQQRHFDQVKPFTLHCSLLLVVFGYALIGGLIFNKLEAGATEEQQRLEWRRKSDCVMQALERGPLPLEESYLAVNNTAEQILQCFKTEPDARAQWGLMTATLYGFGIVTTLGYNRIAPITLSGRLFCVFFGICGIPLTMIIIANIGQYLNQFAGATRKNIEAYRERRRRSRVSISGEDIGDSSIEVMSVGLLVAFLLYVCFGAVLLPLLNGKFDFYNGIYFNFLCLTAIDFGQLVPSRWAFLPITFLYVCIGLAITTIAIDIGSEYMKKLHHFGKKMKNVASTKIWFGGKT